MKFVVSRFRFGFMAVAFGALLGLGRLDAAINATEDALCADVVRVSERFGFAAEDSTKFLQAALDSGLPEIVIDAKATPWVTRPLFAKSNQRIVFEPGAVLLAKRGEFREKTECLLTIESCHDVEIVGNGATLRMWREDYAFGKDKLGRDYRRGEWRHALAIRSSERVTVDGLRMEDSGGDGIVISQMNRTGEESRDIVIRNCVCDRNHRQGLSIISGENLLVENCVFKNTKGTPPEDGVDVEPNRPDERLVNVVVRNCVSENNAGKGYEAALSHLRDGMPVSVRFENCRSVGDRWGAKIRTKVHPSRGNYPTGSVVYDRCTFERTEFEAITIQQVPEQAFKVRFDNCRFERIGEKNRKSPLIKAISVFEGDPRPALPTFTGLVWPDRGTQAFFEYDDMNFAERGEKVLPLREVDLKSVRVVDESKGKFVNLVPMAVKGDARYYVYADRARTIRLSAKQVSVAATEPVTGRVAIASVDGREVAAFEMPGLGGNDLVFDAPSVGFYTVDFPSGKNAIVLTGTDAPVALCTARNKRYGTVGRQISYIHDAHGSFYVPMRAGECAEFRMGGSGASMFNAIEHPLGVAVFDSAGRDAFVNDEVISPVHFLTAPASNDGIWELRLDSRLGGSSCYEIAGVSPLLFLSKEKVWYSIAYDLTSDASWSEPRVVFAGDEKTAYRDPAAVFSDGLCHLYFTLVETEPDQSVHSYVAHAESSDLVAWSKPEKITPRSDRDFSSPGNVVRDGEDWVLSFQSYPRPGNRNDGVIRYADSTARLFTMRSKDLKTWTKPELLRVKGPDVPESEMGRMIDPYLIRDDAGVWRCFYKQNGVSMSKSEDLLNWEFVGRTNGGENVCVVKEGGGYLMMHSPRYGMRFKRSSDLTGWNDIPGELTLNGKARSWSKGRLTAGALLDGRDIPWCGKWILFIHGSGPRTEAEGDFDRNASIAVSQICDG